MEPRSNIRAVCSDCMNEKKAETQQVIESLMKHSLDNLSCSKKVFYKIKLTQEEKSEYVWINVLSIRPDAKTFSGTIDNDLVVVNNYKYGEKVVFSFDDIIDYMLVL